MSINRDSLGFEAQQFLERLCEEINFNFSELQSPLLAFEDRVQYEESLKTALAALETFE